MPRFTPKCFSKTLPSSGGRSYLRTNQAICVVDICELRSIQCDHLSTDVPQQLITLDASLSIYIHNSDIP
jgi:hypothetical protein